MPRIPKIVSKLALVLVQNTNKWFQSSNRRVLCSIRNLYNYILSFVSKSALVLLQNTNERFQGSNRSTLCSFRNQQPVFLKSYQNLHQCCYRIPMNGSRVVTEMFSAAFGTHHPYSKIISYQMLPNTYTRFQSVLKPYSTTSGTRLCVPSTSEI